jgi:hypothetical protein
VAAGSAAFGASFVGSGAAAGADPQADNNKAKTTNKRPKGALPLFVRIAIPWVYDFDWCVNYTGVCVIGKAAG